MKKIQLSLFLIFAGLAGLQAQEKSITVTGKIYDSFTNRPLNGVYITNGKKGCQTNKNGYFILKGLSKGKTRLKTMYYTTYSKESKQFYLKNDTIINFTIKELIHKLDEFVVTGTRTKTRLSETPILTNVIRQGEIHKSASISTLETLQNYIPGIVISPNAMGNNMRIKGLNSRYILFLIDGERMVSEGAGGNINLSQIDVDNIQRIEIVEGASSALYGSNAVGAVINIITKTPHHKFQGGAKVTYQNHNTWNKNINIGTKLKKFQAYTSIFNNSSDGFDIKDRGYSAKYNDLGGNIKMKYNFSDKTNIQLIGRYFSHETFNPENSMDVTHSCTEKYSTGGTINTALGKNNLKFSINHDIFYDYDIMEYKNDKKRKKSHASYTSSKILDTYRYTEKLEIVSGLEYNHEEYYSKKILGDSPMTKTLDDFNIFSQASYKVFTDFDLVGGMRYTYNNEYKSAFSPKIALMYKLHSWKFRAGLGSAFRAPSIKELYYDFNHRGIFKVCGNPHLKAEKGVYSSLSAEYTKGSFNASISVYYNKISEKISQFYIRKQNALDEYHYKNVSDAVLKGFNMNFSCVLLKQFRLKANYSFCDAVDNSTGLQLSSNVKHSSTITGIWQASIANSPFSIQLSGKIHSAKLYQSIDIDDDGNDIIIKAESKPYSIWKLAMVKPFRINKHNIECTFKCDNIFNFKESSFVNPGRQYLVGIRYSFK